MTDADADSASPAPAAVKIVETALDPRWSVHVVVLDGARFPVLRLEHPRFGEMDFLLPRAEAAGLAAGLRSAVGESA